MCSFSMDMEFVLMWHTRLKPSPPMQLQPSPLPSPNESSHANQESKQAEPQRWNKSLCLDSVLPDGEVDVTLVLLDGNELLLVGSQPATDGAGLLDTEIKGQELLALVVLAEVLARLLVGDGQDTGDGFADGGNAGKF